MTTMETTAPVRHVALVQPEKDAAGFGRGERIILVDGVRWGRTYVSHHGMHGTSYTFGQDGGETIMVPYEPPSPTGRMNTVTVRIGKKRRYSDGDPRLRPTDVQVLEKVQELVAKGLLRDPATVRAEVEARREQFRTNEEQRDRDRKTIWRVKAKQALGWGSEAGASLDKVVELMEWAQSQ